MPDDQSSIPEITDEDIDWVLGVMRLESFDKARRDFLKTNSTIDLEACPGSGKTTLVVAKLAILALKWPYRTKGICVLSHTNAARAEIQHRLGGTMVGNELLGYPHFIGTIHSFVNQFLALPWLRSNGYPSPTVDDDVTIAYRRRALTSNEYYTLQSFLNRKKSEFNKLRIADRNLRFELVDSNFPAGSSAASYKYAKKSIENAAKSGYFCYNEMFIWARALLEDMPEVASWIRCRFPFILIDEVQDTSEEQGSILQAVFPRTSADIVVQRVGDPNQAIFGDISDKANESYPFPDYSQIHEIPNSFRFGEQIATLASPFSLVKVGQDGLCSMDSNPSENAPGDNHHTIFIFPDNDTSIVLKAYGKLVLNIFDDATLAKGKVTAVGGVHHNADDIRPGHKKYPTSVKHYWDGYSSCATRKEPHPGTLVEYFRVAQKLVTESGNLTSGVDRVAAGIIRLAGFLGETGQIGCKTRTHRSILKTLEKDTQKYILYQTLLSKILIDQMSITEENWDTIKKSALKVAQAIWEGDVKLSRVSSFLDWPGDDICIGVGTASGTKDVCPNTYCHIDGTRRVDIKLGSIHSVKGQTHLATLLLSTFWKKHSSERMLPWLLGKKVNGSRVGVDDQKRLLQTYVAMTRPKHLICLAIPRFVFGDEGQFDENCSLLKVRGWRVIEASAHRVSMPREKDLLAM